MLYSASFPLRIATPDRVVLEEDVVGVRVPGADGPFEALARHAPVTALVEIGEVRVSLGSGGTPTRRYLAISGGVVEIRRDGASLLVDSAEWAEEISADRASESRERAAGRLRRPTPDVDSTRAEVALARALNRLQVAGRAT
jgi:F-type H+-transporting ATPase subunit epsilon